MDSDIEKRNKRIEFVRKRKQIYEIVCGELGKPDRENLAQWKARFRELENRGESRGGKE